MAFDPTKVLCSTTKGKSKKSCTGWVRMPTAEVKKRWQFQCSVCSRYNLADDVGIAIANSPKPFDLDDLPKLLQPQG